MTTTTSPQRPDTHEMVVTHRVFRRESRLLPQLIRSVRVGDRKRAAEIAGLLRDYTLGLHEHHTGEDELVWPLLLARLDLEADLVLRMEAQHERISGTLARAEAALPAWEASASPAAAAPLLAALDAHAVVLREHLDEEERHVLALIEEHLTVQEWSRLGERFATRTPKDKLLFFLGAILEEATPEERGAILGHLPAPVRLVWRVLGRPRYFRRIRRIRAGLPAPIGQLPGGYEP